MSEFTVFYNCKGCGIEKQPVNVPERAIAVDIALWMEQVKRRVSEDHGIREPFCQSQDCDLMIPVNDQTTMIGKK